MTEKVKASRYTLKPIDNNYRAEWEAYKQQVACFWTVEEINLQRDVEDWRHKLNDGERHFIKVILAFFAASDGIVGENLVENFITAFEAPEVRCFYSFQAAMENIHAEMYSNLIESLIEDQAEKHQLLASIDTYDCVQKKADWAIKWMDGDAPLGNKLVAFAAVEGIFFSCSFCAIFWLKKRNIMKGLTKSNEFISRDEGMHTNFACMLVNRMSRDGKDKPSSETIREIIVDAVDTERLYVRQALQCELIGINSTLMEQYLECVADNLLVSLECPRHYHTKNPFEWMNLISLAGKTNFFEDTVSEYQKAQCTGFDIVDDF